MAGKKKTRTRTRGDKGRALFRRQNTWAELEQGIELALLDESDPAEIFRLQQMRTAILAFAAADDAVIEPSVVEMTLQEGSSILTDGEGGVTIVLAAVDVERVLEQLELLTSAPEVHLVLS